MNEEFYNGKNVLVTGGDGFIGSHLVEKLISLGANVSVITYSSELINLKQVKDKVNLILCDISNKEKVNEINGNFDVVFHLAAIISVGDSIKSPEKTKEVNVIGTRNMLDLAVNKKIKRFVYVSTATVYNWSDKPINENSEIKPLSPYAESKLEAENLCLGYAGKYSIEIAIPRLFNAYGIGQTEDVSATFVKQALNNENITIHGDGKQKKDFLNVKDIVGALLIMGSEKSANNQIVNFGTGIGTEMLALAEKIIKISDSSSKIIHIDKRENDGISVCDYWKAEKLFGWKPKVVVDEGLKEMIGWNKARGYNNG